MGMKEVVALERAWGSKEAILVDEEETIDAMEEGEAKEGGDGRLDSFSGKSSASPLNWGLVPSFLSLSYLKCTFSTCPFRCSFWVNLKK